MSGFTPPAAPGRIFISYRREETAYPAGWLYDRLAAHFGGGQVFKDVDSIEPGDDFVEVITRAVGSCDVLLAVIGGEWLSITDAHGRRCLDNPDDFVRLEIEAALSRRVRVIPVLVGGARMPHADELPDSLAALVRRQALDLSPARFDFDTSRLLKVLDRTLAEVRATEQDPAPAGTAPDPSPAALQEPLEQREHAEQSSSTPGIPLAAPATPARPSSSESDKPPPKRHRRLSARARVAAGAGVGVVLTVVIIAVVANSGTTSPPANGVIVQDNFSSKESDWRPYQATWIDRDADGRYANGAYRISAPPSASGDVGVSSPRASSVYPSAPSNIRIAVQALPAPNQEMEYGIVCRVHGDHAYALTIADGYAAIARYGPYELLDQREPLVHSNSTNHLQAICTNVEGKRAVHLELWVNGQKVAETTDADNPFLTGTVGLVMQPGQGKRVSMAEFDNFAVSRV